MNYPTTILIVILLCVIGSANNVKADQTDEKLDVLFVKLKNTDNSNQVKLIEQLIWETWIKCKNPTIASLMDKVAIAMQLKNYDEALIIINQVVASGPNYAEGWNKRATIYYLLGRLKESLADINHTLELEPRHFGALSGLGLVYNGLGETSKALLAFERALTINPHLEWAKIEVKRLEPLVRGKKI